MYKIKKTFEVAIAHKLNLSYDSPCQGLHGHNLLITVYCASDKLNEEGMVLDFTKIKKVVHDALDHKYLNGILYFNPTAENIAYWIYTQIENCYRVDVQESTGNVATYIADDVKI